MTTHDLRFTTLEGLKRRAKQYGKANGIKHAEALDTVARAGGYANFTQARRALTEGSTIETGNVEQ
ncbi:hypothetical protein [Novosphingobium sp. FKTRR1]|uniref:hypothetical protein n=1 Tax=Novosphingobium sp. FKTRR1 TaxID=2879118 RepID=UPI001CF00660|nr:hypothetical protein [Novosphingobium sp. FKTRR1]